MEHRLTLFADYFQVHLVDDAAAGDLSEAWDDEASQRHLAAAEGIVAIGTARNVDVPVLVRVSATAPEPDVADWDWMVDASLDSRSGRVAVLGCTDYLPDAFRLSLPRDRYRVRASGRGLDSVEEHWLDATDEYRVEMWPDPTEDVRVLKRDRT